MSRRFIVSVALAASVAVVSPSSAGPLPGVGLITGGVVNDCIRPGAGLSSLEISYQGFIHVGSKVTRADAGTATASWECGDLSAPTPVDLTLTMTTPVGTAVESCSGILRNSLGGLVFSYAGTCGSDPAFSIQIRMLHDTGTAAPRWTNVYAVLGGAYVTRSL